MPLLRQLSYTDPEYRASVEALHERLRRGDLAASAEGGNIDVVPVVADILERVRRGGDAAIAELTSQLDRAHITPATLRVSEQQLAEAHAQADPEYLALVRGAVKNVREYQEHIRVRAPEPLERNGRLLGVRYSPVDRVGVYVPGGRALYPSTVVMTVVPAQVAGVSEIVMVSPPTGGDVHPLALALAAELGIREVYRMGGAVAVGALAYGTESIKAVHKIVGPGNAFVAEAKRQVFGQVGIDAIAGPSEVFVVADDIAPAAWVAADLLAQAEHDPGSAILATPSASLAAAVQHQIERQLASLERRDAIASALERYSAIVLTRDLDEACEWANVFAAEHLQIMTRDDTRCLGRIRHAGAIFVGIHTPVPLGDYFAGPSHVLPTGGTARYFGALSCNDFLKATSVLNYDANALREDAQSVEQFAAREGLTAHAAAVHQRRQR